MLKISIKSKFKTGIKTVTREQTNAAQSKSKTVYKNDGNINKKNSANTMVALSSFIRAFVIPLFHRPEAPQDKVPQTLQRL